MNKITLRNKTIGEGQPILTIAEIASAHEGSYKNLIKLIDMAYKTGADAVKFQVFNSNSLMTEKHSIWDLVQKLEFSKEQWIDVAKYTRKYSILMLTDVCDIKSIDTIIAMEPDMVKIHSADLNNFELVENVAKLHIPTMIGIGASTLNEITNSINVFKNINNSGFLSLMHGYQGFPTNLEDMNIRQLIMLKDVYKLPVGFLDHTEGDTESSIFIPLVATSIGAFAIEKHICLDRKSKGIDYESSLSLKYFQKLISQIHDVEKALGSQSPTELSEGEIKYRKFMKKGLVTATSMRKGDIFTMDKINMKRTDEALPQDKLKDILGRKAKINLNTNDNISWDIIQ